MGAAPAGRPPAAPRTPAVRIIRTVRGDGRDEGDDEGPFLPPLPPEDRLWRHPSEVGAAAAAAPVVSAGGPAGRVWTAPGTWLVGVVAGAAGAVLAVAVLAATVGVGPPRAGRDLVVRETVAPVPEAPDLGAGTVVELADRVGPAITRVEVRREGGSVSGSGVLFRGGGYVLTNAHVVDGADEVTVELHGGRRLPAAVLGTDADTDVAVVRVDTPDPLPTAVLGSALQLRVGQVAVAIGSPLGLAGGTSVTVGVISALGRDVTTREGRLLADMIQTDAPIAPGSSGGALLDAAGTVVGITTATGALDDGQGAMGFATPIDVARAVADDLIALGRAVHVWLGISGSDLAADDAVALGIRGGVRVQAVHPGSPAAGIDLRPGDVIVGLAGTGLRSMSDLTVVLRTQDPDVPVPVVWYRGDEVLADDVALAERPARLAG